MKNPFRAKNNSLFRFGLGLILPLFLFAALRAIDWVPGDSGAYGPVDAYGEFLQSALIAVFGFGIQFFVYSIIMECSVRPSAYNYFITVLISIVLCIFSSVSFLLTYSLMSEPPIVAQFVKIGLIQGVLTGSLLYRLYPRPVAPDEGNRGQG